MLRSAVSRSAPATVEDIFRTFTFVSIANAAITVVELLKLVFWSGLGCKGFERSYFPLGVQIGFRA